jgi:hypothetical protein
MYAEWDAEGDITFIVPENDAWNIDHLASEERYLWPCFTDSLRDKLNAFCDSIV